MARYESISTDPKLLAVDLGRQLLPGTIEHAVNYLLDHAVDLSSFDARFWNDKSPRPGAPRVAPRDNPNHDQANRPRFRIDLFYNLNAPA